MCAPLHFRHVFGRLCGRFPGARLAVMQNWQRRSDNRPPCEQSRGLALVIRWLLLCLATALLGVTGRLRGTAGVLSGRRGCWRWRERACPRKVFRRTCCYSLLPVASTV